MLPSSKRQILSLEKEAHIFQTHEYYPDSIAQMGRAEVLILMKSNLPVFSFVDHAFGVASKKLSPNIRSLRFSPVLSSMSSIVLYFTFRSMGYFELIFVKGVRSLPRSIFLHVGIHLLQFRLLKRLSLLHYIAFAFWSKISWLYLWGSISGLSILFH